jgi:hypothetical protein
LPNDTVKVRPGAAIYRVAQNYFPQVLATLLLMTLAAGIIGVHYRVKRHFPAVFISGFRWQDSRDTLVIAVRYGCPYCEASWPFYSEIWAAGSAVPREHLRLIFVSPDNAYLASHTVPPGIPMDSIRSNVIFPIWITGTPTMMLVDQRGVIRDVWRGKLNRGQEQEVLQIVKSARAFNSPVIKNGRFR